MNTNEFIEFKQERDVGTMISDAFKFLKEEGKPFFTTIIKISLVPIILAIASTFYFFLNMSDFFSVVFLLDNTESYQGQSINFGMFFISLGVLLIFYLIAYVMINASAMYYIKSYTDNQGKIDYDYIKNMTMHKFWSFIALYIVSGIIIFTGTLFCFFPGIYLGIVLSLSSCILVFFEKEAMDAIGGSFAFIKGHWWNTFGILIVIGLIVWCLSLITQLPAIIYQLTQMGSLSFDASNPMEMMNLYKDPIYLTLTAFSEVIKFFLVPITLIVTVFIFFDINEQEKQGSYQ